MCPSRGSFLFVITAATGAKHQPLTTVLAQISTRLRRLVIFADGSYRHGHRHLSRCARTGVMRHSKQQLYSMTSSARPTRCFTTNIPAERRRWFSTNRSAVPPGEALDQGATAYLQTFTGRRPRAETTSAHPYACAIASTVIFGQIFAYSAFSDNTQERRCKTLFILWPWLLRGLVLRAVRSLNDEH
jgi:hypothetical protein